ncbi:MAG: tRNA (adenosine(37)-N6)-threonylcarbamoyltransferase complex ATPase subunit type 1 TsaE [Patescibacteria group bacterium]
MKIVSSSPSSTKKIAAAFATKILKTGTKNKSALAVGLIGELGSGKTTFVQSFAKKLGIKQNLPSPTFVLMRNYESRIKNREHYKNLCHIDCYRIKKIDELKTLNLAVVFRNPRNIVLIEWADKIKKSLPKNTIWINFEHGKKENERIIKMPIPVKIK